MFEAATQLIGPAVLERLTLLFNHVAASESVATERLRAHAGQCMTLTLTGTPPFLPAPPPASWRITPAGLLEVVAAEPEASALHIEVDASNPLQLASQWLAGQRPGVSIQGDVELASTVAWLMDNLRWDAEDDLARVFGDMPGRQMAQVLRTIGGGVREGLKRLAQLAARASGGAKETPGDRNS